MPKFASLAVILLFCCVAAKAKHTGPEKLWQQYSGSHSIGKKLEILQAVAESYNSRNESTLKDSTLNLAIETARLQGNDTLLMHTYIGYFKLQGDIRDSVTARENANNMLSIAASHNDNAWQYHAYAALAEISLQLNKTPDALEKINKAYYYAGLTDNDTLKAECFLLWGSCLEQTNNKIDAFRNYLNALNLAQKHQNQRQVYQCYGNLSQFYMLIGNYERAKDYKIKQIALLHQLEPVTDSAKYTGLLSDLSRTYYYNKERGHAERLTNELIEYATRNHDSDLLQQVCNRHVAFLIENNMFKDLSDFYEKQHSDLLAKLAIKDTERYYRVMAYISEAKGDMVNAENYFKLDEPLVLRTYADEDIRCSNFFKRYAQFLLRNGQVKSGKEKMERSYEAAMRVDYLPYLVETSAYLDSLNYKEGNLKLAYQFAKLNKEYSDRQELATKQDALLLMEIDNESRQRELMMEQQREETEHRHNIQYTGITFAIMSSFVLLMMLGIFKVNRVFIKSLGFFSFIFFFEFVILLLDHKIEHFTHGEPWKMLGIKIVIIAFLLPFHHWVEHKVIHYLTEHKLIDASRLSPRKLFYRTPKTVKEKKEMEN